MIIILDNSAKLKPATARRLKEDISRRVTPVNVRVASHHIEVSVVGGVDLSSLIDYLESTVGKVLLVTTSRSMVTSRDEALERYAGFVLEERFWEAHEVLEGVWRTSRNEVERSWLKMLIKVAALMAKVQEGGFDTAMEMASRLGGALGSCVKEAVMSAWEGRYAGLKVLECVGMEGYLRVSS